MKNFDEIINGGVIRWTEKEKDALIGHVPDHENGVFKIGKLGVIATTESVDDMITEHVSVSRSGIKKPSAKEIEMVKNLFWNTYEAKDVSRLYVPSDVIHLIRKQFVHIV